MSTDLSSSEKVYTDTLRRYSKSFFLVFGTILLFFIGQLIGIYILIGVLSLFGLSTNEVSDLLKDNPFVQFLAILLIEVITLGILWMAHRFRNQSFLKNVGLNKKPKLSSFGYALIAYGLYFLTFLVTVVIVNNFVPSINIDQSQQLGFDSAQGPQLIFVFLALVVLPPIAEEIIFRGFLFRRLSSLITIYPAAIITSTIFALAHTEFLGDNPLNWIAAIDTFILSFFLIYLLKKTDSLWASIFLHGIKNCTAFIVLFLL